jgi:hypothetical protein
MNANGVSAAVLNHLVSSMVDASVEADGRDNLRQSLLVVNDFFNQLEICVESQACDVDSIRAYFAAEAEQLNKLYGNWFSENGKALSVSDFGHGLQMIAKLGSTKPSEKPPAS